MLLQIFLPVISRCHQQVFPSFRNMLPDLDADAVCQRFFTHRLYDPGSSQYRNPVLDPQSRVKRLLGDFFSFRNKDRHL